MSKEFTSSCEFLDYTESVDHYLRNYLEERSPSIVLFSPQLLEAMRYSLFSGGKRFRPVLCLSALAALGENFQKGLPYAAALEMVHTYSLIHDDLPCMDNDDWRRGQLTSHKKYSEAMALLAGDALLTESFYVIAQKGDPATIGELVRTLSRAASASGMVGGQTMDMAMGTSIETIDDVERIHIGKTAELISAAIEGAGILANINPQQQKSLREFGLLLGFCFQIKDDLLDADQDQSAKSVLFYMNVEAARTKLFQTTQRAKSLLKNLTLKSNILEQFLDYNLEREK